MHQACSGIKIPFGKITAEQLDVMADLADEYSDAILHVTTRQDIQLHFVHIEDTPDLMRRLAAVGITTREACGNSVRNVTACPYAGTCHTEAFDVTPYANALTFFLLGHDDTQDFGRKFKIAFSGCKDEPCGLTNFHDLGLVGKDPSDRRRDRPWLRVLGWRWPRQRSSVGEAASGVRDRRRALSLEPGAVSRVCPVGREGQSKPRSAQVLGQEARNRRVPPPRSRGTRETPARSPLDGLPLGILGLLEEKPKKAAAPLAENAALGEAFQAWRSSNVREQAQNGYAIATITLPLGDFSSTQARAVADLARKYTGDTLRATVDQNILLRWVPEADLPELYEALCTLGLSEGGAGTLSDVTACPGTDTCKLGISSSRGLAGELRRHLNVLGAEVPESARSLLIKCSGCFNACGQHHVADIGFLGVSRNVNGKRVPHFQLVVGGQWTENAAAFGLAIGALPSKEHPQGGRPADSPLRRQPPRR